MDGHSQLFLIIGHSKDWHLITSDQDRLSVCCLIENYRGISLLLSPVLGLECMGIPYIGLSTKLKINRSSVN